MYELIWAKWILVRRILLREGNERLWMMDTEFGDVVRTRFIHKEARAMVELA